MLLASATRAILCCSALGARSLSQWTHCGKYSDPRQELTREDAEKRQRTTGTNKGRTFATRRSLPCRVQSTGTAAAKKTAGSEAPVGGDAGEEKSKEDRKRTDMPGSNIFADTAQQSSPPLNILHLTEDFAVVSKPPLMHVHRPEFGSKDREFVMQKARNQLRRRVYLPHRLDRGTSGCLLVGFSPESVKVLQGALGHPTSSKTYLAIVRGSGKQFVDRGWFKVDRPIKDDNKVVREASTRFLFVRGGFAPDPRCCLVLAQPSTGRRHQIRRHLNGLNHPIVGDSAHGSSKFNREVAEHPRNPAPAGRLMLHCLQLLLPTLPAAGSKDWRQSAEAVAVEGQRSEETSVSAGNGSGKARLVDEDNEEPDGKNGGGSKLDDSYVMMSTGSSGSVEGRTLMGPDEQVSENAGLFRLATAPGSKRESRVSSPRSLGVDVNGVGAMIKILEGGGLEVYDEPPDDMMAFLRGMSWWEEGMIQAAERSSRWTPPP